MTKRDVIVSYLDSYLDISGIADDSWNGLQFEGKAEVQRIVTAVDSGVETFERAVKEKADMVIVHHGQFWSGANPSLRGWSKRRFDILAENGISLYAAHLPLDRHPVVGNNAELMRIFGAKKERESFFYHGAPIGWIGTFAKPVTRDELARRITKGINTTTLQVLPFGPEKIRTLGICSGGGGHVGFFEAMKEGVDAYVSGEVTEVYHGAKDARMNVFFAGHHATETVGVRALGEHIRRRFKVPAVFIDIPTGL